MQNNYFKNKKINLYNLNYNQIIATVNKLQILIFQRVKFIFCMTPKFDK